MTNNELIKSDLRFVVQRIPKDVRDLLTKYNRQLFIGGGFIRACIAKEEINDIDLFGDSLERLELIADELISARPGSRKHKSKNAITVITPNRTTVQFITRWLFNDARKLVKSFDFTICQAAIWRGGHQSNARWESHVSERFYIDLAGRNLVYTNPEREEEAGGSMLRVLKYAKRGYSIQINSLGDVINRLTVAAEIMNKDTGITFLAALSSLLREVDPLLVIDGFEVVDDHQDPIEW